MDLGLRGKTAVITGASKGIGLAVAHQFLQEGANVAICARKQAELDQAAAMLGGGDRLMTAAVDMSSDTQVYAFADAVYARFGGLDCWVNNVGATAEKKGENYTDEQINWFVDVCFKSAVYGCQAAFRYMKKSGGAIVNISSLAARCGTAGRSTLYGPLKAAVRQLSVMYAGEYAAYGVRVNTIMPGFTVTPAVKANISAQELDTNARGTLLHRLASPEEIARPVVFLASGAASYVTAATLEVSGGRCMVLNTDYSYEQKAAEEMARSL